MQSHVAVKPKTWLRQHLVNQQDCNTKGSWEVTLADFGLTLMKMATDQTVLDAAGEDT